MTGDKFCRHLKAFTIHEHVSYAWRLVLIIWEEKKTIFSTRQRSICVQFIANQTLITVGAARN